MPARDDLLGWSPDKEAELREYKRQELVDMRARIDTLERRCDALETWRANLQGRVVIIAAIALPVWAAVTIALAAHFLK